MLKIHCLTLGDYQTNCYIIWESDSARCCVIDPGYEASRVLHFLREQKLEIEAILLTHCHFDHVGAVREIAAETDCDVYLSEQDLSLPPMLTAGPLYYTHTYPADGTLNLAGLTIRVIPTPGHTPGSVCLLTGDSDYDAMFSGDTLFCGSCGRTDLPGGSWAQISQSLKKLAAIPKNYHVFPGHGEATTLDEERKFNPYI